MIGSLFSGYGGLDMAAESLGFGPVAWHCEIEPAPAKVLAHHYPDVPNLGDITAVDWSSVTPVDVLVGGFPCQDVSAAGKRAGIEGARSGLWSCYADAIRVLRPKLVLVENVSGLRSRGLDRVLGDLAEVGYDARWCSVRASDAGAPHRRERFFIVASSAALVAPDTNDAGSQGAQPAERRDLSAWGDFAPAVARWSRLTGRLPPRATEPAPRGGQRLGPRLVEWMMGLPDGWVTSVGLTYREQLKMLGNGVVPQQAALALRTLLS